MMAVIDGLKGEPILVDDRDIDLVSGYRWRVRQVGQCRYAINNRTVDGVRIVTHMHRLISGAKEGELVDHINGNGLDNQRTNLRLVTAAQNQQNRRGAAKHSKTGVRGVHFEARKNRYVARVGGGGKAIFLAYFKTLEEAAVAVVEARAIHMTHSSECNEKAAPQRH